MTQAPNEENQRGNDRLKASEAEAKRQMAQLADLKGEVERVDQLHQKAMDKYERLWTVHLNMAANAKLRLRVRDVRGAYRVLLEPGSFSMLDN